MPTHPSIALAATALSLAACAVEPEPELGAAPAALSSCKPWGCSDNSPVVANQGFHELHRDGIAQPNPDGLYIDSFTKAGVEYQIDLVGPALVGRDTTGAIALDHGDLENAVIDVRSIHDPAISYQLEIKEVTADGAYFWQGNPDPVETYRIEYGVNGGARGRSLCNNPSTQTSGQQGTPMNVYDVALFGSERYHAWSKTIAATGAAADGWINFGCAGGSLAKLLLNRHVPVAHTPTRSTTVAARQAMLKMFAADYTGTGRSFTHTGEPLYWRDAAGWVPSFPGTIASFETWWTATGALCLQVPRLATTLTPYAGPGALVNDITAANGGVPLPACSTLKVWPAGFGAALFISANPSGS